MYGEKLGCFPASLRKTVKDFGRQALHAELLEFIHPDSGELVSFSAPLAEDFTHLLERLR